MGTFPETWRKFSESLSVPSVPKWVYGTKHCHMNAKCMICGGSSHAKNVCPVKEDTEKFVCSNAGAIISLTFGIAIHAKELLRLVPGR